MEKLKPCPFCGEEVSIEQTRHGTAPNKCVEFGFEIRCKKCGATLSAAYGEIVMKLSAQGDIIFDKDGREQAIAAWNTRADNAEVEAFLIDCKGRKADDAI